MIVHSHIHIYACRQSGGCKAEYEEEKRAHTHTRQRCRRKENPKLYSGEYTNARETTIE